MPYMRTASGSTRTNASWRFARPSRIDFTSAPFSTMPASKTSRTKYSCRARRFVITVLSPRPVMAVTVANAVPP